MYEFIKHAQHGVNHSELENLQAELRRREMNFR